MFSAGPEREGVPGVLCPPSVDGEGRGDPPRGVMGVLGAGLVSRMRGEGLAMVLPLLCSAKVFSLKLVPEQKRSRNNLRARAS